MNREEYYVIKGIVKTIKPKGKDVIGIADGEGMFVFVPLRAIIKTYPHLEPWQTTYFQIKKGYNLNWIKEPEIYYNDYLYKTKVKPPPKEVPLEFALEEDLEELGWEGKREAVLERKESKGGNSSLTDLISELREITGLLKKQVKLLLEIHKREMEKIEVPEIDF